MAFVPNTVDMLSRDNETVNMYNKSSFASSQGLKVPHFSGHDVSQPLPLNAAIDKQVVELNGPQEQSDEDETESDVESVTSNRH